MKIISKSFLFFVFTFFISSLYIYAQNFGADSIMDSSLKLKDAADAITNNVMTSAIALLMTAAFAIFFYGVAMFIFGRVSGKGTLGDLEKGKTFMKWGLIALFVMMSVWGIIRLVQDTLKIEGGPIQIEPVTFAKLGSGSTASLGGGGSGGGSGSGSGVDGTTNSNSTKSGNDFVKITKTNYTDTSKYPLLVSGSTIDVKSGSTEARDGRALNLLYDLLDEKNCLENIPKTFSLRVFTSEWVTVVKEFQTKNGLYVDGKVGKDTWEALSTPTGRTTSAGLMSKDCGDIQNIH